MLKFDRLFPIITEAKNSETGIELAGWVTFQIEDSHLADTYKSPGIIEITFGDRLTNQRQQSEGIGGIKSRNLMRWDAFKSQIPEIL